MNSYSHIVLAEHVKPILNPSDPEDYFWGAVAPDVRYVAKIQRQRTHLERKEIFDLMAAHPQLRSFLQGYLVHILADEIDLDVLLPSRFPLNLTRKKFSQQQMAVLVELFYLDDPSCSRDIRGTHNEILDRLGILPEQSACFGNAMNTYISAPCWSSAISAFRALGLLEDRRIENYQKAANTLIRSRLLLKILFLAVRSANLEKLITDKVRAPEVLERAANPV